MSIRDELQAVFSGYREAQKQAFTNHPLANRLRGSFPSAILVSISKANDLLIVKGSAGQGTWNYGPWVAIFSRLITDSAQRGFYPVYLFSENMTFAYLSLNQAVTETKLRYKTDAKTALRARAENFRAMLGTKISPFSNEPIDLAPSKKSNYTAFYEAGNICSVRYEVGKIPSETVLISHLNRALELYEELIEAEAGIDPESSSFIEGGGKKSMHSRIERNHKLVAEVKKKKGLKCEACDMEFERSYGELGNGFIEVHHRVPFAEIKHTPVVLDPVRDFSVLCANCHRMIHRMRDPSDIEGLRKITTSSVNSKKY